MKQFFFLASSCLLITFGACHHVNKDFVTDVDNGPNRMGAIYISCESPPWLITMDGILSCEFDASAPLQLNPLNACAMKDIADENGSLSFNFSLDTSQGRMVVEKLNNDIDLKNQNGDSVEKLYLNDTDHFFIENGEIKLRMTVKNAYVGGCFHELIQWEEMK